MKVRIYFPAILIFLMGVLATLIFANEEFVQRKILQTLNEEAYIQNKQTGQDRNQNKSKQLLYGTLITLLVSVYIALIKRQAFRCQQLAAKHQAKARQLTEINRVSGMGFWEWDIKTNRIYWSDQIYKIFDLVQKEDKLTYDQFLSRVHPDDRKLVNSKVDLALKNQEAYEIDHRILVSNDNIVYVHEKGSVNFDEFGNPVKMIGTVQDITSHIKINNEVTKAKSQLEKTVQLRTRELRDVNAALNKEIQAKTKFENDLLIEHNRAQLYLDAVNVVLLGLGETGNVLLLNSKGQEILGYSENEILGNNWFDRYIPENERNQLREQYCSCVRDNKNFPVYYENQVITKQGELRSIAWRNVMLRSNAGDVIGALSSGIDITEAKKSQEQLILNLQALNTIFESDLIGVLNLSPLGNILTVNQYVCALSGYEQEELVGRNINSLIEGNKEISDCLYNRYSSQESSFSVTLSGNNMQHVFIDMLLKPVVNSSGSLEHFLCLIIDVTEKVKENQRMLEREKHHKKALIREIHHRIKNHLQGVMGLIQNNLLEHPEAKDVLEKSMLQINALAVTYGLQSKNDNGEIYLCDLVNASVEFNNNLLHSHNIKIELSIPTDRPFQLVRGSAVPVSLIINELLLNAIKHSTKKFAHIDVDLTIDVDKNALIRIENSNCRLPEDFDFNLNKGMGTGLELIKALLPEHTDLTIKNIGENVVTEFCLKPPLITYQLQQY